jgi:hypothetical protein
MASQDASIDDMKHHIINWARTNVRTDEIVRRLRDEWGIKTSRRTVYRRLDEWGFHRHVRTEDTPLLRASIAILFRLNCTDVEMVTELADCGYIITLTGVKRIRLEMGLRRRMSVFDRQARDAQLFEILKAELDEGHLEGYGRRHLYTYFRKRGQLVTRYYIFHNILVFDPLNLCLQKANYLFIHRTTLFSMLMFLNPIAIERRIRRLQSKKGEYIVPGPDWIWSIDGHDKLSPFGIEIYACIDAYSRNIIWIYVGISNRTSHSVVHQYLITCAKLGYCPKLFRADRGGELPLIAEAHFAFSRHTNPDVKRVEDCFWFGKSTKNQRIESWWQELEMSQLFRWRVSATSLRVSIYER